ncbi:alpha/beta hydrolase [Alloalcanivorax xenomutans]|uniref:alpha/beta hydrolase n=1 Tax=Alloalcanivorax xenomutans TaxID=1094342 RepID=UPI00300BE36D
MSYLPCVEIEPPQPAETSVIWLHGLGASGHDFEPVVPELARKSTRFVFPHAPQIPVTVNGGMVMPAWYDIISLGGGGPIDEDGIRRSAARIDALIEREIERGIPAERIVVAGFSQGGAVAYEVALRHPARLAGLMALSTYFATADSIQCSDANQALPIFIAHGTFDPMEHAVCLEEIQDIAAFLHSVLD